METQLTKLNLVPYGFPVRLGSCPAGFFLFKETIGFKSEYGHADVYCSNGEAFWGGTSKKEDVVNLVVQPLVLESEQE